MQLDHIAIVVNDIHQALGIYQHTLGLPLQQIEEAPAEQVKVAFLPLANNSGRIELLQPTTPDTGVARFLATKGEGIHHICLAVDNLDATLASLQADGMQIIGGQPRTNTHGQRYVFIHPKSANGVLLELYQK